MLNRFGGHPIFNNIANSPSLLTRSKALVRSMKAIYSVLYTDVEKELCLFMMMLDIECDDVVSLEQSNLVTIHFKSNAQYIAKKTVHTRLFIKYVFFTKITVIMV